jgi:itaconate CoA-transferase
VLDAAIAAWCARHGIEQVQKVADAAGIGNSRHNLPTEVVHHRHLVARSRRRPIDTPGGPTTAFLPPPVLSCYEPPMGAVPSLGEHTDSVLTELGLTTGELGKLREQGVIGPRAMREASSASRAAR